MYLGISAVFFKFTRLLSIFGWAFFRSGFHSHLHGRFLYRSVWIVHLPYQRCPSTGWVVIGMSSSQILYFNVALCHPGTPNQQFKWMFDMWLNNSFPCKDLVHHPIDSQPFINGRFRFRMIALPKPTVQRNPHTHQPWKTSLLIFSKDASISTTSFSMSTQWSCAALV